MKVRKKLKWIITFFTSMVMVLGFSIAVQAASNPYPTQQDVDGDGYYEVPCTRFAWQQAYDKLGIALPAWGNAGNWYSAAKNAGMSVGSVPKANSIAVWTGDTYGHVAYVTAVSGTNTFTVNEGGRTDLDRTSSHGVAYGYTLTNAVGQRRPYDTGKTLAGFIYLSNTPTPAVSITWSGASAQDLGGGNYKLSISANSNVRGSYTEAGFTVYNEAGGVVAKHSEKTSISGTRLNIWNDLKADTGVTLKSGTNYKYQFYAIFNGKRYNSPTTGFKTSGKTANEWVDNLHITDWVYGKTASVPTASAKYGNVEFTYSSEKDGEYTKTVPTNAGTYYVKAQVQETSTYTGLSAVKEFHIIKAVPTYTLPKDLKATYGQKLSEIQLPKGFSWLDDTVSVGDVGEKQFKISYVPEDTTNYFFLKGLDVSVTVEPKDMSGTKLENIDKNTDLEKYEIKDGEKVLVKDRDYTIETIKENTDVTVKVTFKGNYTGTTQTTYSVKENDDQKEEPGDGQGDDQKEEPGDGQGDDQKEEPGDGQNNDPKEEKPNGDQLKSETKKNDTSQNDKKTNNTQNEAKGLQQTKSTKTGDNAPVEMFTILAILSGAVLLVMGGKKLKK